MNRATDDWQQNASAPHPWTFVSALTLGLLGAAATVLRFLFLARKPFWFDEAFSAVISQLSWHDFVRLLWSREANMALYYVLLRGWLHFDFSPSFIRSLSVLASLATLPAIFWLSCKLFDRRVGLIAVALLTCNAYQIRYAQEARSYSLFVLLATLSSGFFVGCLREPSRRNRWSYVLVSVLAVYAHLYALLLLAAQWLSVRGLEGAKERVEQSGTRTAISDVMRRPSIGYTSIRHTWIWIGVAILPLLVFAAKTGAGPIRWISWHGFHGLLVDMERFAGNDGLPLLLLYTAACLAAILPLRASLFRQGAGWDIWRYQFLLVWLLFPAALTLLLSLARPLFVARYFIFCLPPLTILAAAGLANLRKPWMVAICLATMLLLSLRGTLSYYDHDFDLGREGSEAAANYIFDHTQPGDAILFHIAKGRIPYEFVRLLRARDSRSGPAAGPEIIFPRHRDRFDYRDLSGNPTSAIVRSVPVQHARVWVVLMMNDGTPGKPDATTLMLDQAFTQSFPRIERVQFPEVEVTLYSTP